MYKSPSVNVVPLKSTNNFANISMPWFLANYFGLNNVLYFLRHLTFLSQSAISPLIYFSFVCEIKLESVPGND